MGKICPFLHKTKIDARFLSFEPECTCPHISEAAYVEKGGNRGQVCVETHMKGQLPYQVVKKLRKKTLGGNPKCFFIILSNFAVIRSAA